MPNEHFYSTNIVELAEDNVSEVEVLRAGVIRDRNLVITEKMLTDFVKNHKDGVYGAQLQVNLGHNREGEAAGWISDLYVKGKQLMAKIEWTKLGAEKLKNKLYKFVSAEFADRIPHHETGKIVDNVFIGLALTNVPAMKGQSPIALSEEVQNYNLNNNMFKTIVTNLSAREYVSSEDKALARELFSQLSEEEQAEAKEEMEAVEAKPEAPAEEKPEAAEEAKEEAPVEAPAEAAAPTTEALSEKLNATETKLSEVEAQNKMLTEKIEKQELSEEFEKEYMLSETREVGLLGEQKEETVSFLMGLSPEQRTQFKGIMSAVKVVDLSTIGSTEALTASGDKEAKIVALADQYLNEGKAKNIAEAQKMAAAEVK